MELWTSCFPNHSS